MTSPETSLANILEPCSKFSPTSASTFSSSDSPLCRDPNPNHGMLYLDRFTLVIEALHCVCTTLPSKLFHRPPLSLFDTTILPAVRYPISTRWLDHVPNACTRAFRHELLIRARLPHCAGEPPRHVPRKWGTGFARHRLQANETFRKWTLSNRRSCSS